MAATGFLIPAQVNLTAIIGADFSTTINLYTDTAQTTAFDLTGYTVTLTIGGLFTLTAGSGLTVTPATGTILATLTAAQTVTVAPSTPTGTHYSLKLIDGAGIVSYPLQGQIQFVAP